MATRAWKAGPHEAEAVARLLIGFRDHMGYSWPSDNAFLAGVENIRARGGGEPSTGSHPRATNVSPHRAPTLLIP